VPADRVVVLEGGGQVEAGGRTFEVAYTPGHASHHVSYFDPSSGVALVGDTAGIRRSEALFVMPPTPPPDIDLPLWKQSVARISAWQPSTLFVTHFGPYTDVRTHLSELIDQLDATAAVVTRTLALPGCDDDRVTAFADDMRSRLRQRVPAADAERYERAAPLKMNWQGMARYLRKAGLA
jgi:glyoxylase-like metal-dependent hydrolase (beta-lactamase superfamily II)